MFKELLPLWGERRAKGLGKRNLPDNPDSTKVPFRVDHLSKNAKAFWEHRGYGAFVVSIVTDERIKTAIGELGYEDSPLLARYLIGILARDDRQAVRGLPKHHPDRKAFAEIFWYEKRRESEIVEDMVRTLEEKAEIANADEVVGRISKELAGAAYDIKSNFFRNLTTEVGAAERDQLIAFRLRFRASQIARIREQAIAKSG